MKKQAASLFLAMSCVMLAAGGCAQHQLVKKEDTAMPAAPAAPRAKTEPVKTEPLPGQSSHKENSAHDTLHPIPGAGEITAAMEDIYFDFDAYALSEKARDTLGKNTELMKKEPRLTVQIEGHCDERGSDEYNLALGERRAKAAMRYMVTMGIPEQRLSVISYGKEKPAAPGHDEASWARNRRDGFVITTK